MQRLRYLIFLAVILAGVQSSEAHLDRGNRALSDTVSMLVDNIDEQIEARNKHLVELKKRYQETSGRARIESANEIAVTYLSTNLDTAAQYFRLAFLEARSWAERYNGDISIQISIFAPRHGSHQRAGRLV